MHENEVYKRIVENQLTMSKSHKKVANYLIENQKTAAFLTVSKLAKNVGVGEATIIRFATSLGFDGYSDMQKFLQQAMQQKFTSAEEFSNTTGANEDPKNIAREILSDDIHNMKTTLSQLNLDVFNEAVSEMIKAKRIYIISYRSAASIGSFLEFYLNLVLQNTEMIRQSDGATEHLLDISDQDMVITISFPRYTKRTIETLKYVKQKGAKTLVITDHLMSPLVPYGDITLFAETEINSFIDSFSAPLSIINALITAITRSEHQKVENRLKELEELWDQFDIFYE
ncbi:MurR/RpiR family transcriptional regulator [Cytobacillus oceanisediminis]|uniref:RpiR family transcriptional regulator n=1 Tax=Cytobacillus oceanisediminis TaxID=665099 RepID=A0A562J749_9BACI|nr:MurR/RpiR family transcriptional regulator [Cytobacillus oceanisediminis]TWH78937.1 RpiR family transcriptional regulator [Cytobacillus oceanisediminis]